jgi:NAD(P)-dependent dehydrogenase (short-subunit alcohol dehydrogenase family)
LVLTRTVLITGVNGGIGASLSRRFKEAGWNVVGVDLLCREQEYCDLFLPADVADAASVKAIAATVSQTYGRLDCLINNAALQIAKPLVETTEDEWDAVFGTNVAPVFYFAKYFFELLADASIINIASVHARATSKGLSAYAASKGAVSALTRAMAVELAEFGIRVNAILPGAIETAMLAQGLGRNRDADEARTALIRSTPLQKIGNPDDVANLALFLADSSLSGNITGQEIVCDGGVLAKLASE